MKEAAPRVVRRSDGSGADSINTLMRCERSRPVRGQEAVGSSTVHDVPTVNNEVEQMGSLLRWVPSLAAAVGLVVFSMASAPGGRQDATSDGQTALIEQVNEEFGLYLSTVAWLDVATGPGIDQRVVVPFGDESFALRLFAFSVRSNRYEVLEQLADGSYATVEPGPVRTVRGVVEGMEGSVVAGSVLDDGLRALIQFPDGERWWVEPLGARVAGAGVGEHVIYREADVIPHGGSCATEANADLNHEGGDPQPLLPGCEGNPCVAEMAVDSDVEYFNRWGAGLEARVNLVINTMNVQYEDDVGITHVITTLIIRPIEPDPYSTNDPGTLLNQFRTHWLQNHQDIVRDLAHLFTGRNINGGVIGIAFVGVICTSSGFGLVQSDCCGSLGCATDLSAHEIGHNWNALHCSCSGWTMNSSLTCANRFHATFTVPTIEAFRDSRTCLSDAAPLTTFPFEDQFVDAELDPTMWVADGATVDNLGDQEPSEPFSLHVNGDDRPMTGFMDVRDVDRVAVEYWWQRTGTVANGSPEVGNDLLMEYLRNGATWTEATRHAGDPGGGGDDLPYERSCVTLPDDALHDSLQIRFRIVNGDVNDTFFVDNLRIIDGAEFLFVQTQPELDCACMGGTGEFSVVAGGIGPFTYQWMLDGALIPGATNDTLIVSPDAPEDFGNYSVDISNDCGTIESESVPLLQATPVTVTASPQDVTLPIGGTLAFFGSATGQCAEFQWFFNDEPIPGANASFLFIPNLQCENQGCYHFVVSNDCGQDVSETAQVTVETCSPFDCAQAPPVIVHGAGLPGETRPFSGYVDPRSESSDGSSFDRGITQVQILFSEPVEHVGGGPLAADSFVVTQTGAGTPPAVASVDDTNMPLVIVMLNRPITVKEYTTIQAVVQDLGDPPAVIVDAGNQGPDADESDRVDIAFLPADVDQSGDVSPFDLLMFRQIVNDLLDPQQGTEEDYVDMDRDGSVSPFDLLLFRQLINGITPATQPWAGETLNNPRP